MSNAKIRLGIFIDWFLPAYKAGGPIQSISNLVNRLKNEFEISIITSNSDLDAPLDLDVNQLNIWITKDGYRIIYLDSQHQNINFYKSLLDKNSFDVVYFNSLFSLKFTHLPLWILRNKPIRKVLATRGMLAKGALALKHTKKKLFLNVFKCVGLHKKVIWHATSPSEVDEIKMHFGKERKIELAPNLSTFIQNGYVEKHKIVNELRIFFLSRIAIKKNLLGALEILSKLKTNYKISFTIIGPIDDKSYWKKCLVKIDTMPDYLNINYLGAIPNHELSEHLRNEHLLLLPTYGENFGHVIMESWQNGCPVVISDQTPWHDLEGKKLGYDIPLDRFSDFINAIESFCTMNKDEFSTWSKTAFDFAKEFIENPAIIEQNRRLFTESSL